MNLTNIHNLPEALVAAVRNDSYVGGGDISTTKLIDAPQRRVLYQQYKDFVVEDVSERIWSLMGQSIHHVLERADSNSITEERLYMEVNGWKLSGQLDRLSLSEKVLDDYKMCSTYKRDGDPQWEYQLNVLDALCRANGYVVDELRVIAIFRDWQKSKSLRDPTYPQTNVKVINVRKWSAQEQDDYILQRVKLHQAAVAGEVALCTDEERWHEGNTYALLKKGGKRATKVSFSREELGVVPEGYVVDERLGGYRRCENYCEVSAFCKQHKDSIKSEVL